nr:conserved phage C-terminal domain-containing protein [Lysinibacillus timonensis]
MSKLLVNESYLILIPALATIFGLNEAIVLQQLHFRLQKSPLQYDGYTWYNQTYADWKKQFPFWSEITISRIFLNLEKKGVIISSIEYNRIKTYKTKYYRIDYEKLNRILEKKKIDCVGNPFALDLQLDMSNKQNRKLPTNQIERPLDINNGAYIKEERKKEKERKIIEKPHDVVDEVIEYLNTKANREFRSQNNSTRRLIHARLKDGYTLNDFKKVINLKVKQWINDKRMKLYLRPSTLFNPTNFENYLNETIVLTKQTTSTKQVIKPIVLDFSLGEED